MRKKLRKHNNERKTFIGRFEKYGYKKFAVMPQKTVLFKDIKDINGNYIADHVWVDCNTEFNFELKCGDLVQFNAKIKEYIKGYWDLLSSEINIIKPLERDYKLDEVKKVCLIKRIN